MNPAGILAQEQQRTVMALFWRSKRLSRWELHQQSEMTPNAAGLMANELLEVGLIRECPAEPAARGRPRVPLEIDPQSRNIVGLAIGRGTVIARRVNLLGELMGDDAERVEQQVDDPGKIVSAAAGCLKKIKNQQTLAISVTLPGIIDTQRHLCLLSAAIPGQRSISLAPILQAAQGHSVFFANDVHALAARWLLTHASQTQQDVLIAHIGDGFLGSVLLVGGRPNEGSVMGANELGHMRLAVDTAPCYCGQRGCLERVCSTEFIRKNGGPAGKTLLQLTADSPRHPALAKMTDLLAMGIANVVNFIRPYQLILTGDLLHADAWRDVLISKIQGYTLAELASRMNIAHWVPPTRDQAHTAAWPALAYLYASTWPAAVISRNTANLKIE